MNFSKDLEIITMDYLAIGAIINIIYGVIFMHSFI
jgi:hypothetical protein